MAEGIKNVSGVVSNTLSGTGNLVNTGVSGASNVLNKGIRGTAGLLNTGVKSTSGVLKGTTNVIDSGVSGTANLLNSGVNNTAGLLNTGISGTADVLNSGVNGVSSVLTTGVDGISNILSQGIDTSTGLLTSGLTEVDKTIRSFSDMLDPDFLLKNGFLYAILVVFLTMYGPRLHPKLPSTVKNLFNNPLFRMVVLFMIGYLINKNFVVSLVIALLFTITFNMIQNEEILNGMAETENFLNYGPPVANCTNYDGERINKIGVPFYPLSDNENSAKLRNSEKHEYQQINLDNPEEINH